MVGAIWLALSLLLSLLILEMYMPSKVMEGFQAIMPPPPAAAPTLQKENVLMAQFMRRGDVGPYKEEAGYKQDKRFYGDWADVQRLGESRDYCRMLFPDGGSEEDSFFACALAGTSGMSSISYRTKSVKDGFQRSRDDYINRIRADGRHAYCRILKMKDGTYGASCLAADDTSFGSTEYLDTNPPEDIKTLVDFYRGCRMWLRLRDDMVDYMGTTIIQIAGNAEVADEPRPTITRALHFNGKDQYLRIADSDDLSLGNQGSLRSVRAFSLWVKFDEFTNNAHIFDFGNGSGVDNVFLGIYGKGDADSLAGNQIRPPGSCQETTIPDKRSGAQFCPELSPQDLFLESRANIDEYTCPGTEVPMKEPVPILFRPEADDPNSSRSRATLLFEIWDSRIRKMQIKLNRAVPKGQWTHIVITAKDMDALRPDILVYINGSLFYTQEAGCLPQNSITSSNYIGKSNWTDAPGEYELRDELFSGSLFDFRIYNVALSESRIKRMLQWGMGHLGLSA